MTNVVGACPAVVWLSGFSTSGNVEHPPPSTLMCPGREWVAMEVMEAKALINFCTFLASVSSIYLHSCQSTSLTFLHIMDVPVT